MSSYTRFLCQRPQLADHRCNAMWFPLYIQCLRCQRPQLADHRCNNVGMDAHVSTQGANALSWRTIVATRRHRQQDRHDRGANALSWRTIVATVRVRQVHPEGVVPTPSVGGPSLQPSGAGGNKTHVMCQRPQLADHRCNCSSSSGRSARSSANALSWRTIVATSFRVSMSEGSLLCQRPQLADHRCNVQFQEFFAGQVECQRPQLADHRCNGAGGPAERDGQGVPTPSVGGPSLQRPAPK